MPRKPKGPRLYWRKPRSDGRPGQWVIRDGETERATGTNDQREAESRLEEYLAEKRGRPSGAADDLTIAQALTIYGEDYALELSDPARVGYAIDALLAFAGWQMVSDITGALCRRYVRESKKSVATCRRELGVLRAAMNYCEREGYLKHAPPVVMPENSEAKDRWLTRREMALILRASRRLRVDGRHLSKFILAGRYTGTRKSATLALTIDLPSPTSGYVNTETGILHRIGSGEKHTKKRRGRAKAPRQFLAHVRRWKANGCRYVVETNRGERVADIRKGWARMIDIAQGMAKKEGWRFDGSDVTPHTLRHTAITWAMQNGANPVDVSSFFSVSMQTLERTYWHHHPDFQESAVKAMEGNTGARTR